MLQGEGCSANRTTVSNASLSCLGEPNTITGSFKEGAKGVQSTGGAVMRAGQVRRGRGLSGRCNHVGLEERGSCHSQGRQETSRSYPKAAAFRRIGLIRHYNIND